jgi:hypothetical protein
MLHAPLPHLVATAPPQPRTHARPRPQVQFSVLGITDVKGSASDEEFLAQLAPFNFPPAQQQLLLVLKRYTPRSEDACSRLAELSHEEAQQVVHAQMAAFVAMAADVGALLPCMCLASAAIYCCYAQRSCVAQHPDRTAHACPRGALTTARCHLPTQVIANQPVFQRDLRQSLLSAGLQCKMEQCMSTM